jgi:hypothetical protein
MGRMSFESQKSGPLDSVVNIPKIGDFSDFGSFEPDFSGESMSNYFMDVYEQWLKYQPLPPVYCHIRVAGINLDSRLCRA